MASNTCHDALAVSCDDSFGLMTAWTSLNASNSPAGACCLVPSCCGNGTCAFDVLQDEVRHMCARTSLHTDGTICHMHVVQPRHSLGVWMCLLCTWLACVASEFEGVDA